MNLLTYPTRRCLTVNGILIHNGRVLLIKHKKLNMWLNPGGHIEPDEVPHQAAEREFWEETGLKVKAIFITPKLEGEGETEFLPNPLSTNLHWVCRENYDARIADPEHYQPSAIWKRGCEQHLCFSFVVQLVGSDKFKQNEKETNDIRWFTEAELKNDPEIDSVIKSETLKAFEVARLLEK